MQQWVREFHTWWPQMRVAVLHSSTQYAGKENIIDVMAKGGPGNVLIMSYSSLRRHQKKVVRYSWHYAILDEGHIIRNPDAEITLVTKQLRTSHRIILSGTPIQNNLVELWSLFDFVFPGLLGTLPTFLSTIKIPLMKGTYANASAEEVQLSYECACVLRDTIRKHLLRRAKADVQSQILLPPRTEQVLFCNITDAQRGKYEKFLRSTQMDEVLHGRVKSFMAIDHLRKLCNHIDLATPEDKFTNFYGDDAWWRSSGKMVVVDQLLQLWHGSQHRPLLFVQTRQMLKLMERYCNQKGFKFLKMDGTTAVESRQALIHTFNTDKSYFMILLTTKVGGVGVNLTGADRVIIFDPDWNPSTGAVLSCSGLEFMFADTQARERAWRIGQQKNVCIYRLLTAGTIEEKIYHRQA